MVILGTVYGIVFPTFHLYTFMIINQRAQRALLFAASRCSCCSSGSTSAAAAGIRIALRRAALFRHPKMLANMAHGRWKAGELAPKIPPFFGHLCEFWWWFLPQIVPAMFCISFWWIRASWCPAKIYHSDGEIWKQVGIWLGMKWGFGWKRGGVYLESPLVSVLYRHLFSGVSVSVNFPECQIQ